MDLLKSNPKILISPANGNLIEKITALGFDVIPTKPIDGLISFEKYHADMQMLVINSYAFIPQDGLYLKRIAENNNYTPIICEPIGGNYPKCVALNAALVGNKLICKADALSKMVQSYCEEQKIEILNVRQGYAKCSTLVLNDNAIITADVSICKVARTAQIDVHCIRPGYINLEGADYGFVGGSSFVIGDTVVFFGDISTHPDSEAIISFINNYNMKYISLFDGMLTDVGGGVIL